MKFRSQKVQFHFWNFSSIFFERGEPDTRQFYNFNSTNRKCSENSFHFSGPWNRKRNLCRGHTNDVRSHRDEFLVFLTSIENQFGKIERRQPIENKLDEFELLENCDFQFKLRTQLLISRSFAAPRTTRQNRLAARLR